MILRHTNCQLWQTTVLSTHASMHHSVQCKAALSAARSAVQSRATGELAGRTLPHGLDSSPAVDSSSSPQVWALMNPALRLIQPGG
jgi:hypothetical protein